LATAKGARHASEDTPADTDTDAAQEALLTRIKDAMASRDHMT